MDIAESSLLGIAYADCGNEGKTVGRCKLSLLLGSKSDVKLLGVIGIFTKIILSLCQFITRCGEVAKHFHSTVGKTRRHGHAVFSIGSESLNVSAHAYRSECKPARGSHIPLDCVVGRVLGLNFNKSNIDIGTFFCTFHHVFTEVERRDRYSVGVRDCRLRISVGGIKIPHYRHRRIVINAIVLRRHVGRRKPCHTHQGTNKPKQFVCHNDCLVLNYKSWLWVIFVLLCKVSLF